MTSNFFSGFKAHKAVESCVGTEMQKKYPDFSVSDFMSNHTMSSEVFLYRGESINITEDLGCRTLEKELNDVSIEKFLFIIHCLKVLF